MIIGPFLRDGEPSMDDRDDIVRPFIPDAGPGDGAQRLCSGF